MSRNNEFVIFGKPYVSYEEKKAVQECIDSGWLGTGPKTFEFEKLFSNYKGKENALAVNSCTAALHLALLSLNLQPGDEVITTPITFCATVNTIIHAGGTPVLVDIDSKTWNIDVNKIEEKISNKTKAILPVHFAGRACNMNEIIKISKKYNLSVIEDCAHSVEGTFEGKSLGTIGDYGCFSFYSTKNIITVEGGMLLAKDEQNLNQIKIKSLHGMDKDAWKRFSKDGSKSYDVTSIGFKYNMTDYQSAMGVEQLKKVDKFWARRKEIWDIYNSEFENLNFGIPAPLEEQNKHSLHLFTLVVNEYNGGRDAFIKYMNDNGVGVGIHYQAIPAFSVYKELFGWDIKEFPNAELFGNNCVSIPLSPGLSHNEVEKVVKAVRSAE